MYEVREAIVFALRRTAELECRCPGVREAAGAAAAVLRELTTVGAHVTRWRNPERGAWTGTTHVAGVVRTSVEHHRGRVRVVDGRQACERCGRELERGKGGLWFKPGEEVVTDQYSRRALQLWAWRRVGGTIWEECTPGRVSI